MEPKGYQNSRAGSSRTRGALALILVIGLISNTIASDAPQAISVAELASRADVVALVQTRDTDYVYRRNFPYRGSAFMKVLITYKGAPLPEIIEVYEEGLHDLECYFPTLDVFEEGRRYLVFLRRDDEKPERYRGMDQGCALEILVRSNNLYAVRIPIEGVALSDDFALLAQPMDYADAYAFEEEASLTPFRRDELLSRGYLVAEDERFRYTHGIDLSQFRALLEPGLR